MMKLFLNKVLISIHVTARPSRSCSHFGAKQVETRYRPLTAARGGACSGTHALREPTRRTPCTGKQRNDSGLVRRLACTRGGGEQKPKCCPKPNSLVTLSTVAALWRRRLIYVIFRAALYDCLSVSNFRSSQAESFLRHFFVEAVKSSVSQ